MNISYNWLKEHIAFDLSPDQIACILTSIGLETRIIKKVEQPIKDKLNELVVGKVVFCKNHPNSKLFHIINVDIGIPNPLQIVCNAPNVAINQKVIVATTIGTNLYSQNQFFFVKKSKIKGIESQGIICSEFDIGIGSNHEKIIVLPEEIKIGSLAKDYYKVKNDFTLSVDIPPNRIDAASHHGIARDLAAYLSLHQYHVSTSPIKINNYKLENSSTPIISVTITHPIACPRYTGVTIKDVTIKESPQWLKKRLEIIEIQPINNITDIINYILYELGQPINAFDLKSISGNQIIIKTLVEGTNFVTLNKQNIKLSSQDIVVCDREKGLCIGGIIGGLNSIITTSTKDLFLESAYFNPTYVRRTARFHKLNTDSSFYFERGTDPNQTLQALSCAIFLIQKIAGGIVCGTIQDIYPIKISKLSIVLNIQRIGNLIGKIIPEIDIETILNGLQIFVSKKNNDKWILSIPTHRADITREVDVIEEILRIYGHNKIETIQEIHSPRPFPSLTLTNRSYEIQNILSEQLIGGGFHEIINNSITSSIYYKNLLSFRKDNNIFLENPLSTELDCMRQTLLFGGLKTIAYNIKRKQADLKLYEFGNIYLYEYKKIEKDTYLPPIKEELHLALWITGNSIIGNWVHQTEKTSFFELKSYIESILIRLKLTNKKIIYRTLKDDIFSSGLSIETISGQKLGSLGILQKNINKKFDIHDEVYFAELNWHIVIKEYFYSQIKQIKIQKFPSVRRDLSLLVDKTILFSEIEKIAYQVNKKNLKKVTLFDVYEGENIPEGKKSYTVSFILQDAKTTLQEKKIEHIMNLIKNKLLNKLNAKLR